MFGDIISHFEALESERNYWFIRTMKGRHFDVFKTHGFIGIAWNYITTEHLLNSSAVEIKTLISENERNKDGDLYDINTAVGRRKITSIYNKIIRFKELKKGDFVVIPSAASSILAFGIVDDDNIYSDFTDDRCDLYKRRKINWIVAKELDSLDPIFYKIIFSKHAISSLDSYAGSIDKIINSIFIKDNKSHLVLNVKEKGDINYDSLNGVLTSVRALTELINNSFLLNEDLRDNSIKLNVQSPGAIEFIYKNGRSLLIASVFLSMSNIVISCDGNGLNSQVIKSQNLDIMENNIRNDSRFNEAEKTSLIEFSEVNYDNIIRTKENMKEIDAILE
ncbi:hypothetical protein [Myroides odoratimimus]|uniref:hypothetical protein n=1 Tax=Myroides odoratimimus TaxID=76832 RepID=UPI002576F5A8|nr:hypothetical protein [Myroides odoratimimus]MDM1519233.1 hypothetical protein [Myroides odoratimimus]